LLPNDVGLKRADGSQHDSLLRLRYLELN